MTSSGESKSVRVFVIDDHPLLVEGIRGILEREADMRFCGGATSAAEGLARVCEARPDVCVVDVHLPDGNGIDLTETIRSRLSETRVLVLSICEDRVFAERALRAGANGYLAKIHAPAKLIEAIRQCAEGKIYLSEDTTSVLLSRLVPVRNAPPPGVERLSEREFQVFERLGEGLTNPEIAEQCCLSVRTVETYYGRIKEKLNLANTARLRQFAIQWSRENCAA
ncbi:MAG: response regulator transcription factor [Phycisphaerae bacterium]|nr:response regulator transcription factor [Phycisphaerae bacterium]